MSSLVKYRIACPGVPLRPIDADLYEYVLAANGVFVRAKRSELALCLSIASCETRGLAPLESRMELKIPRVPQHLLRSMLESARQARDDRGVPAEILFHLSVAGSGDWVIETPEQVQKPASARPLDDSPDSSYARALLEVHSHVDLPAHFSTFDDRDEEGFRLYAVLGRIYSAPELRVRVGLYGYWWEISASVIFELPPGIQDCLEEGREMG